MAGKKKTKPSLYLQREHPDKIHQAEDLTLKSASAIFGVDLLNCLDVSQSASREYEAAISRTYNVSVTTYVLCSSKGKGGNIHDYSWRNADE